MGGRRWEIGFEKTIESSCLGNGELSKVGNLASRWEGKQTQLQEAVRLWSAQQGEWQGCAFVAA